MLSEARKWRLSLVLAHQFLAQLPDSLRHAVLGNAGSLIAFRIGAEDAEVLAPELGIDHALTLTDTANFAAWAKLMTNNSPTDAIPVRTLLPGPHFTGRGEADIARTRARYTRPRWRVEKENDKSILG